MRRNHLGQSVAATLVLLLAGCGSTGDDQVAEAPVTSVVTEDTAAASDESWLDSGWMPNNWFGDDEPDVDATVVTDDSVAASDESWLDSGWMPNNWFGNDEPDVGATVVPPPDPASFAAVETLPPPVPNATAFAAIDTTTGTDPVTAAQEPTLGEEELAIMPDAPPPEIVAAAMPVAPSIPAELQTDDPTVLAVRYSSDLNPAIIQLLTPNGTVIEPLAIGQVTHWTEEDENRTRFQFGLTGGSASGLNPSLAVGIPIFGGVGDDHRRPTQNQANFKLPDMADYQANWQLYRVVMLFEPGTAEEERLEMLPPDPDAMLAP